MISAVSKGSFKNTELYLQRVQKIDIRSILQSLAEEGKRALASATPIDSGLAENSWGYKIEIFRGGARVIWTNSDIENGFPVVIGIQYGHGTGTGGYIQGRDFINPAMKPIFDQMADRIWKAVTSA